MEIIGLIPAAGSAKRLPNLPCSKEIYPIGSFSQTVNGQKEELPKPVILYLFDRLKIAGAGKSIIIINKQKIDVMQFLGDGNLYNVNISYLVQEVNNGMPNALNLASPWTQSAIILFGMPDTIFFPENAFKKILEYFLESNSDLTLGLFPTDNPSKFGMVEFDENWNFVKTVDKPETSNLEFMWGIGCWSNTFTSFMNEYIGKHSGSEELVLGTVIQAAHNSGLILKVVPFFDGKYYDIGTPEDLQRTIDLFSDK